MKLSINKDDKFGKLTVIKEIIPFRLPCGQTNRAVLCVCECGRNKIVRLVHLVRNRTTSCGCSHGELHGESKTKLYTIWRGMKNRCYGEKYPEKHLYSKKGITLCDQWKQSYLSFKRWAIKNGYKENLQIDRIDGNKNYDPNNCHFVEPYQNTLNRAITIKIWYHGEYKAFALILRKKNMLTHYFTILARIKRGWIPENAIDIPIKKGNYRRASN